MIRLAGVARWLEDAGHAGCAEDLAIAERDSPAAVPGLARDIADCVARDEWPVPGTEDELPFLIEELRALAAERERAVAWRPPDGQFAVCGALVTLTTPRENA